MLLIKIRKIHLFVESTVSQKLIGVTLSNRVLLQFPLMVTALECRARNRRKNWCASLLMPINIFKNFFIYFKAQVFSLLFIFCLTKQATATAVVIFFLRIFFFLKLLKTMQNSIVFFFFFSCQQQQMYWTFSLVRQQHSVISFPVLTLYFKKKNNSSRSGFADDNQFQLDRFEIKQKREKMTITTKTTTSTMTTTTTISISSNLLVTLPPPFPFLL